MNYIPVFACVAGLYASYMLGYTPLIVSAIYLVLSLATIVAYGIDKAAARNNARRVPENNLHILSLLGGWPGAIVAQQAFRHKTVKTSFRIPFWITTMVNVGALAWLHTGRGSVYLNTFTFGAEDLVLAELGNGAVRTILLHLLSFHA